MGLDYHGLSFLRHVHKQNGPLGDVVTLGRQEIHVNDLVLKDIVPIADDYVHQPFCEALLTRYFGANLVEAIDNSAFEQAAHVLDLNRPLPDPLRGRYDTVLDIGTLEHVYDVVQALENCSHLVRPGGQIVHVLPTNNFCGHGFWQFSPELFFSLYSPANGYRDTEVYVGEFVDKQRWFKVSRPQGGKRVNIMSSAEVYVMVRTMRAEAEFSHAEVYQSDYAYEWDNAVHDPQPIFVGTGPRAALMRNRFVYDRLFPLYHRAKRLWSPERLTGRNPGLTPIDIAAAIA